jgi:hypothetical protein
MIFFKSALTHVLYFITTIKEFAHYAMTHLTVLLVSILK